MFNFNPVWMESMWMLQGRMRDIANIQDVSKLKRNIDELNSVINPAIFEMKDTIHRLDYLYNLALNVSGISAFENAKNAAIALSGLAHPMNEALIASKFVKANIESLHADIASLSGILNAYTVSSMASMQLSRIPLAAIGDKINITSLARDGLQLSFSKYSSSYGILMSSLQDITQNKLQSINPFNASIEYEGAVKIIDRITVIPEKDDSVVYSGENCQ